MEEEEVEVDHLICGWKASLIESRPKPDSKGFSPALLLHVYFHLAYLLLICRARARARANQV